MRVSALAAMLAPGKRQCRERERKKEYCLVRECASCEDTTTLRPDAFAGQAVGSCCIRRGHGSSSFSIARNCGGEAAPRSHNTSCRVIFACSDLIRRWIAGTIIQICIERTQLLIDLRIAIEQLQIVHRGRLLRPRRLCATLHPDGGAPAHQQQ